MVTFCRAWIFSDMLPGNRVLYNSQDWSHILSQLDLIALTSIAYLYDISETESRDL